MLKYPIPTNNLHRNGLDCPYRLEDFHSIIFTWFCNKSEGNFVVFEKSVTFVAK